MNAQTATVDILECFNKDKTVSWHLAYNRRDDKIMWLDISKPRNWQKLEKKALKIFREEERKKAFGLTIFEKARLNSQSE